MVCDGWGLSPSAISLAALIRSGWFKAYLMLLNHSSLEPSWRLMATCPGGTLTGAWDWSEPGVFGGFFFWRWDVVGECCEWLGGRVIRIIVAGWWFGVVNPFGWIGWVGGVGIVFPLSPGLPLVGGRLVVVVGLWLSVGVLWRLLWVVIPRCGLESSWWVGVFPWWLMILYTMSSFSMLGRCWA